MSFERYEKRGRPAAYPAIVRIEKSGVLGFNMVAWRAMGEPKYAELWFDRSQRLIGVKPVKERSPLCYSVVKSPSASTARISAQTYLRDYGIDHTITRRYAAEFKGGLLVVDLSKPEAISARAYSAMSVETARKVG